MNEALDLQPPRYFEQDKCSCDVGFNNGRGFINASIDMRLGCKVNNGAAAAHGLLNGRRIADVATHERIIRILCYGFQIGKVPSICQLIVVNELILSVE